MPSQPLPKTCLVTGGAGFIGSHLVEALVNSGCHVRVLDNLSSGMQDNLQPVYDRIEFIEGDIRNYDDVLKACQGADAVLHHAAIASVYQSMQEPLFTHDVNVTGTMHVLEAARQSGVNKINFASSAAVYGADIRLPKREAMAPVPVSPYGLHKWMGEQACELYARLFDMQIVCFRYFNVFGPRQNPKSQYSGVISIFIDTVLSGGNPTIYGDGKQSRDFVSVHDVVQANLLALQKDQLGFEVFNVGHGFSHNLLELLDWLRQETHSNFETFYKPDRRGDLRHSLADISKIQSLLGYYPTRQFHTDLSELVQTVQRALPASSSKV